MLALGLHYQVDVLESLTLTGCILDVQFPAQPGHDYANDALCEGRPP